MYYPPNIENLRKSVNDKYVSLKDVLELIDFFVLRKEEIPFVLGVNGFECAVIDVAKTSPIFISEKGVLHTELLFNFISLSILLNSPQQLRFVFIDPLGVSIRCINELPHMLLPTAKSLPEILGLLKCIEEEILRREQKSESYTPIIVLANAFDRIYNANPEIYKEYISLLLERGKNVNVFSVFTVYDEPTEFVHEFVKEKVALPQKLVREPYERDIVGLIEETIYKNYSFADKRLRNKYLRRISDAKDFLENCKMVEVKRNISILEKFFESLKILSSHKKISIDSIMRFLGASYEVAAKILNSLLVLSIIKKCEENENIYILDSDNTEFCEIVNSYIDNVFYNGAVYEADNCFNSGGDDFLFRSKKECFEHLKSSYTEFERPKYILEKVRVGNGAPDLIESITLEFEE